MKKSQQGFMGILIVILIAGFMGGGLYYKTKINPDFLKSKGEGETATIGDILQSATDIKTAVEKKDHTDTDTSVGIQAPTIPATSVSVEVSSKVKVCSDAKCFTDAIDRCTPAKFVRTSKGNLLGSFMDANFTFETVKNPSLCSVKVYLNKYNLSASEGVNKLAPSGSSAQIEEMYINENLKAQILVGKAGVCTLKNNKEAFIELLEKNLEFYLMMGGDGCEGELFKEVDKLMQG